MAAVGAMGFARLLLGVEDSEQLQGGIKILFTDLALLLTFIIGHTFFARGFGRKLLNKPFGPEAERPLYVFISGLSLFIMVSFWQTSGPLLWTTGSGFLATVFVIIQISGLALVVWSAVVLGAAGLAALPHLRALEAGRSTPKQQLVALPPYSLIRQPMNLGFLLMLWAMPEVSADRLLLIVVLTIWIALVAPIEERDAELSFGDGYSRYKERTPRWIPRVFSKDK
jgi:protein-S-isoprenylcysteine O-methyltransferase Ste14